MVQKNVSGGAAGQEGQVSWVTAEVGYFGQKVQMAPVIAGEEEEEGMDGLAIQGAELDRLAQGDHHHRIEGFLQKEVAGVGHCDPVGERCWHEPLAIQQQLRDHLCVQAQLLRDPLHDGADQLLLVLHDQIVVEIALMQCAIEAKVLCTQVLFFRLWQR